MLDRESCERRVYRLATLLVGDRTAATKVLAAVLGAQPDVRKIDGTHLDRLTVLRSREMAPAIIVDDDLPPRLAATLGELPPQQREAWIFARVYQCTDRETARAMDCSVTAGARHLERAEAALAAALGPEASDAAPRLLQFSMRLDVPPVYRRRLARRRRMRRLLRLLAILAAAAGLIAALIWWLQSISDRA